MGRGMVSGSRGGSGSGRSLGLDDRSNVGSGRHIGFSGIVGSLLLLSTFSATGWGVSRWRE